jgi:hypothetical protein
VLIDAKGKVVTAAAISGPEPLRQPAVEYLKGCAFKPATFAGKPVKIQLVIPINYQR